MESNIILSTSEKQDVKPYTFEATDIKVYSLEEALYHCYYHWKQSWDEIFVKNDFILWVKNELELSFEASEIKKLRNERKISKKIIGFLKLIYFFENDELDIVEKEISLWETKSNKDKLIEKADNFLLLQRYEKAALAYGAALAFDKTNHIIMNNIGICNMKLKKYHYAVSWLEKAAAINFEMNEIVFNLIEAYIYSGEFGEADELLKEMKLRYLDEDDYTYKIDYFYGLLYSEIGNFPAAAIYYENASKKGDILSLFELAGIFQKQRKFDNALKVLNRIDGISYAVDVNVKKSEIYADSGNISASIKFIQKALIYESTSSRLWTLLAKYYRMDYDLSNAEGAIYTALRHNPDDNAAKLELAKIRKSQGKLNEYRSLLDQILKDFKNKYREMF